MVGISWAQLHRCALYFLLALISSPALAINTIDITPSVPHYPLGQSFEYLEDPTQTLTIDSVIGDSLAEPWIQSQQDEPNLGHSQAAYWFRVQLNSPAMGFNDTLEWLLEVSWIFIDHIEVYLLDDQGRIIQEYRAGQQLPFSQRPVEHRHFIFPMEIELGKSYSLYLRVISENLILVPATIWEKSFFDREDDKALLLAGISWGTIGVMAIYNIFLYLLLRDKIYLYYVGYSSFFLLLLLNMRGLGYQFLWSQSVWWENHAVSILVTMVIAFGYIVSSEILNLRKVLPWADYIIRSTVICYALSRLSIEIFQIDLYAISTTIAVAFILEVIACSMYCAYKGDVLANTFTAAWSVPLAGPLITAMSSKNWLPYNKLTEYATDFGLALQVILISMVIAARINQERRERARIQAKAVAVEAKSQARNQFFAQMSHELRTPMSGVIGMAELLEETQVTALQKHYIKVIHDSSTALVNIVNDILDISKIEAGKMELETVGFDLEQLIHQCSALFTPMSTKVGVPLVSSVAPNTPLHLMGDPTRLRQIINNLVGNAFKFTSTGQITLRANLATRDEKGLVIRFEVSDTGTGISAQAQESLFDAFQQEDNSTTRLYGGTGLGLSIAKQLTQAMDGEIGVTSRVGVGSTFWFTAKFLPADNLELENPIQTADLTHKRLLVIDDSPSYCDVIREQAQSWGMHVDVAYHGDSATSLLSLANEHNKPYDLVTLDRQLPGMSGLDIAYWISRNDFAVKPAIIILTVSHEPLSPQEKISYCITAQYTKPIPMLRLRIAIANALHLHPISNENYPIEKREDTYQCTLQLLVAEDNKVNTIIISNMLEKFGAKADFVENGLEAVQAVSKEHQRYDLVLMDFNMPQLDGIAATQEIRKLEQQQGLATLPIVALSAAIDTEFTALCDEAGMQGHLAKPYNKQELFMLLQKHEEN